MTAYYRGLIGKGLLPEGKIEIIAIYPEYSMLNGKYRSIDGLREIIEKHADEFPEVCTALAVVGSPKNNWELSRSTIRLADDKEAWMPIAKIRFQGK